MFQIHGMDEVDRQAQADYHEYQTGMSYSTGHDKEAEEVAEKVNKLYDRLDAQWAAFLELGFLLSAITGTGAVICLMRVFGAGALAFSVALMALISTAALIVFFWRELSRSQYKLRVFLLTVALIAGLTISMSDMAIDGARHYWAILSGASIITGVSSLVVLALIMAARHGRE